MVPIGACVDQCGVVATEKTPAIPADIAVGLTEVALLREFFALLDGWDQRRDFDGNKRKR